MELIKKSFKNCNRLFLEETFNLEQLDKMDLLTKWIDEIKNYDIEDYENRLLSSLQENLIYRVDDWNEQELTENFIGPLLALINFNSKTYGLFSERLIKAIIGDYELSGQPDAMVAKGRRVPKIPYFCFHEYKKEIDNEGDPQGQCLAAMMVAQELNNNNVPIFGIVVKGERWYFMVLQGKKYAISKPYKSVDEELFEIVKLLKHLKSIIEIYVNEL